MLDSTFVPQKEAQDPEAHCSLKSLTLKQARERESSNGTKAEGLHQFFPRAKINEDDSC